MLKFYTLVRQIPEFSKQSTLVDCVNKHSQTHSNPSHRVWNEDKCEFMAFLRFEQMVCSHVIESSSWELFSFINYYVCMHTNFIP